MSMARSKRARGATRGGVGGGYEPTDPDYEAKKLARLRREYAALDRRWHETFLAGLSRWEREQLTKGARP